jgi:hypothetical protein
VAAAAAKKKKDDDEPSAPPPSQGEEEVERRRQRKGCCRLPKPPPPSFLLRGEGFSEIGAHRAISPGESAASLHAVGGGAGWDEFRVSLIWVSFFVVTRL